jgi:hypothetical protein
MHQIETPQGRLFYLYWKLHRENRITIDAKNRLKGRPLHSLSRLDNQQRLQDFRTIGPSEGDTAGDCRLRLYPLLPR